MFKSAITASALALTASFLTAAPVMAEGPGPCALSKNVLQVTGLSVQNAQAMVNHPENFTYLPWCNPMLGVTLSADLDANGNRIIDSLEPAATPAPTVTPQATAAPTPKPTTKASPTASPAATPTPTPVLGASAEQSTPSPTPAAASTTVAAAHKDAPNWVLWAVLAGIVALVASLLWRFRSAINK